MALSEDSEGFAGGRSKGRPRLEDALQIDRGIRTAAIDILLQYGDAATMNAIARAAGLSRKTLYARYPNKGALFLAVLRGLLADAHGVEFDMSAKVEQRVFNYARAALDVIATPAAQALQRLLTMNPAYIAELEDEMKNAVERHFGDPLRKLLTEAHRNGELVVADIDQTAKSVVTLILADSHGHSGEARASDLREPYARFLTDLLCRGLLPRPAAGE